MEDLQRPRLEHYQQFKDILGQYKLSSRAKNATKNIKLVLLLPPTSGGKNTIIRHQLATGRYYFIVSDTTRPPRKNDGIMEISGREYWFRTEKEMLKDLKAGELLEAEIIHNQQVSGISIRELEKAQKQGKIAITDIELMGAHNIRTVKPDTVIVLLVPPSFVEWQKRLAKRGKMTKQEQRNRFETAMRIFRAGLDNNYNLVITENVAETGRILDDILQGQPNPHQARAKTLINQLIKELKVSLT